jgi:uncharacterized protein with PIN domain
MVIQAVLGEPERRREVKAKEKMHRCVSCEKMFPESKIEFSPDPYAEEISGNKTPVWECESCRHESAMGI